MFQKITRTSLLLALAALLLTPQGAFADALDDQIKADYKGRSQRPVTSSHPQRTIAGAWETPNKNPVTRVSTLLSPIPGQSDPMTQKAYYSANEGRYWVHTVGGIAGFNRWEGPFDLRVTPQKQLSLSVLASGSQSQNPVTAAKTQIIRSDSEWQSFWTQHRGPNAPSVDFKKNTVVAVFAGQKPTGGYGIAMTGVKRNSQGEIEVEYKESSPPAGGFQITVLTYPYQIASINSSGDTIKFVKAKKPAPKPAFSDLDFARIDSAQNLYETLTINAGGLAVYEKLDSSGHVVLARYQEQLVSKHMDSLQARVRSADFFNAPAPGPNTGNKDYAMKVTNAATNQERKINYKNSQALDMNVVILHNEFDNLLNKFAPKASPIGAFEDIVVSRHSGQTGRNERVLVRADGTAERVVSAPNIRTMPLIGRLSGADRKTLKDLYKASNFFQTNVPTPAMHPSTPSTTLTVRSRGLSKTISHPTSVSVSKAISALENFLLQVTILPGKASFDSLSVSHGLNGFILQSKSVEIDGNGLATWTESSNGQSTTLRSELLGAADMANLEALYQASEFLTQNSKPSLPRAGASFRSMKAKLGSAEKTVGRSLPSPYTGNKAQELQALEDALVALLNRKPGSTGLSTKPITVEGPVSVLKSLPTQVKLQTKVKTYTIVGAMKVDVEALAGKTVKVEGQLNAQGEFDVSKILSPKAMTVTGMISSKNGDVTIKTKKQSYTVTGPLSSLVALAAGKDLSIRGWVYDSGDFEATGVHAKTRGFTFAFPLAFLRGDTSVVITERYGSLVKFEVKGGNGRSYTLFTSLSNLKAATVVVKSRGAAGALRGTTR